MRPIFRLAIAAALAVLVAACGSDDGTDPQPYIDAVRADLESSEDGPPLPEEATGCLAEAIVEAAGADRLEDAGVEPEDLAAAESFQDLDADIDDDEVRSSLEESLAECPLGEPVAEVFASELPFELPADGQQCVAQALDEGDELASSLAATFVDGDDSGFEGAFAAALAECPAATAELIANAIEQAGAGEVSQGARDCLTAQMEERGEDGVRRLLAGGAEAEALGQEIGEACQAELG